MRFLASLVLLSSLAMAERVPVLSEPRTAPESGRLLSLNAWGDTLVGGRWGRLDRFVRRGDEVIRLDSLVADSIQSEMPRVLSSYVIPVRNRVLDVDFFRTVQVMTSWFPQPIDLGYGKVEGDAFSQQEPGEAEMWFYHYFCGPKAGYLHGTTISGRSRVDSLRLGGDTLQVCSIDPKLRHVVRIQYSQQGAGPATVLRGDARNGFTQMSQDTLTMKPTVVFAAWDLAWLAYERSTGTVALGGLGVNRQREVFPVLKATPNLMVKPARKDSLVVFAAESSLVLAKWTRDHFKVTSVIQVGGRIGNDLAIGDSTVWVSLIANNTSSVVSFRLRWEERSSSAISIQPVSRVQIRSTPEGAVLTHVGAPTTATFLEPTGRVVGHQILTSGENTWRAPHTGLFLVHTTQGTSRIMVR